MFTHIYNFKKYNFWKSGLLLDFFFKKFIYLFLFIFFYTYNIIFGEKYIIEHNFLKLLYYINFIKSIVNFSTKQFTFYIIGFLLNFSLLIIIISLNV